MMIEQNTNYAYKLKYLEHPTFDKVRDLAIGFRHELPQHLQDELYEALNRGIDLLSTEPQMITYLDSYGKMHQAKLNFAYKHLPENFLVQPEINIIDYGCGQALGVMCYADFLKKNCHKQNVKTITLIEPSEICLKRAALHASVFFPDAEIKTINKNFNDLTQEDIVFWNNHPILHILSNVLDIQSFSLDKLAKLISNSFDGYNQFICVGPYFNYADKDNRMSQFCSLMHGQNAFFETFDKYELNTDKAWTAQINIFKTGVLKNRSTAIDFEENKFLAEQGDAKAQYSLGRFYCEEKDNRSEAFRWFNKSANQNHDDALTCLGCCFQHGYGTSKDYDKSLELYLKSASLNNCRAQASLGKCYYMGQCGVNIDYKKAFEWFGKAAEQDYAYAQYYIGQCYYYGKGINKNYQKAFEWYEKSAKQGRSDAQYMLGNCYYDGNGVQKDINRAVELYRLAAEQQYVYAQTMLGNCYALGNGVVKDYNKAVELYKLAAKQGHCVAQYCLGVSYSNGYGVPQNHKIAFEWYIKAAEQNYANAQYNIGVAYSKGYGIQQDYTKAIEWFEKAAKQNNANAQYNLGACYKNGYGVHSDKVKAIGWYTLAAKQGHKKAIEVLQNGI